MDRKLKQSSSGNWSEIRSVLFQSLPDEIFSKGNQKEWLTYHWNLVVGKEIAEASSIDKVTKDMGGGMSKIEQLYSELRCSN